jgi:hypothetical protein
MSVIYSASDYIGSCKKYLVSVEMVMYIVACRKDLLSVVIVFILGLVRNMCFLL